jgi:hypothetical protein
VAAEKGLSRPVQCATTAGDIPEASQLRLHCTDT